MQLEGGWLQVQLDRMHYCRMSKAAKAPPMLCLWGQVRRKPSWVMSEEGIILSALWMVKSGFLLRNHSIMFSFSSFSMVHVLYTRDPSDFTREAACEINFRWSATNSLILFSSFVQRMSAFLPNTPSPEQGASNKTLSAFVLYVTRLASATMVFTFLIPNLMQLLITILRRSELESIAII